jgi:hypothetical protein
VGLLTLFLVVANLLSEQEGQDEWILCVKVKLNVLSDKHIFTYA